ncbi:MAG: hypothetical protein M9944_13075 [Rhizobiaceae bacterium]|nr:hypothetical protein [Rhizobiaceae bacterium]
MQAAAKTQTITGVAQVNEILASVEMTGAKSVNDQLVELATMFKEAAKIIDPTITGAWFGHDPNEGTLFFVNLERKGRSIL